MTMEHKKFFPYSWHLDDDEQDITSIRVYGLDEKNANVCVRINNFTPYVYIELPERIRWDAGQAQLVGNKLDELLGQQRPLKKVLMMKKKLYGAHVDVKTMKRKLFPYLFCSFSHPRDIKTLGYKLRRTLHVVGLGALKLKMHEGDADPILQLTCCLQISTAGWVEFHGKKQEEDDKLTLCDHEYKVKWKHLSPVEKYTVPRPKIMGFDIEVNSTNPSAMPKAEKPGDKVFQISCVIAREGAHPDEYDKHIHTLGDPDQSTTGDDVIIHLYNTEAALLEGFKTFIREQNPNIIVGYNILGFDIPYMIARAKFNMCIFNFDQQGFHKFAHAKEKTIKWSSAAYKNQEFEFLDSEGRLYVDLLPLVRRDFKFNNYKLKTVSEHFLGVTKDPLSVKGIFKCYRLGIKKNKDGGYGPMAQKAMGIVSKYCVMDSVLVVKLMDKLKTWVGLTEMANTCNVPIFTLYTQGQQIKVYSQLYKYCMYENIVVEKDGYQVSEGERYVGAKVFPPIPGRYKMVVPFDFASLYPTTIIAYNIDYHTWVPPDSDIPDRLCHVMNWTDHVGCIHDPKVIRKMQLTKYIDEERARIKKMRDKRNKTLDKLRKKEIMTDINIEVDKLKPYVKERSELNKSKPKFPMCAKRSYRFLKEPKGVMPTVIQNLLDARKHTRKVDMVKCYGEINRLKKDTKDNDTDNTILIAEQKILLDVLNKRQLAFKISANSMYGAMGVRRGYLPFMPGAMCLTGDSLISFSAGYTRRLDKIINTNNIWSYNNTGQICSSGMGIIKKGKKMTVKITLQDGRILRCTPDHKIMTTTGWLEAKDLKYKNNQTKVIVGLELPEDIVVKDTKWALFDYDMSEKNRDKSLAFARVLGFILADGYIGEVTNNNTKRYISSVSLGTLLDANIFVQDICILTNKTPKITSCERKDMKGFTYKVSIPIKLVSKIILLDGIMIGKRIMQYPSLPCFLLDKNCPKAILREFLGGLFGGDGTAPSLSIGHPSFSFSPIQLNWQIIKKYSDDMLDIMKHLIQLLYRFDLEFNCMTPTTTRTDRMTPKDCMENPRICHGITCKNNMSLKFAETIGFRYSINKSNRLTIAASYQRFCNNVIQQRKDVILKTNDIFDSSKITINKALEKALEYIYNKSIPLHDWGSFPSVKTIYNYRANMTKLNKLNKLNKLKLLQKYFPTASEYVSQVNCEQWFKNKYSVSRTDLSVPCLNLSVIGVRYDEEYPVYDIIDVKEESFFANGICVHNCTTYMGRVNIEIVAKTIPEKFKGELIYGDTDSNYIHFPHLTTAKETWDYALEVAAKVTKLFPPPICLEFEEEIYAFFFILSKKRYMYRKCLRDGVVENKIGKKGVLLARRDNSGFVRNIYECVVGKIADDVPRDEILNYILYEINKMCSRGMPYTEFVITKAVGNSGDLKALPFVNEKGVKKAMVGDYTVPILSSNKDEREEQMLKKGADNAQNYYLLCLPAQVQLAEKMKRRGQRVDTGTRLEYIVSKPDQHTAKQYEKVESADYLAKHQDLVKIDYMYYLKALVNPLDQILDVAYGKNDDFQLGFTMKQYKYRWKVRNKCLKELEDLFQPTISFD